MCMQSNWITHTPSRNDWAQWAYLGDMFMLVCLCAIAGPHLTQYTHIWFHNNCVDVSWPVVWVSTTVFITS